MKIGTALCALLLLALCSVSAVSAGGMVKFHIPELESAKVGDTVTATLYNDNNLNPALGDLSLYLDWNMEVLKYESSSFEQGRTTNAALVGLHNLNVMAADTTNGFPTGDNPLLVMKFRVVGPGYTPIVIRVDRARDVAGADISSKAVTSMGSFTGTGTASTKTPAPTPTASAGTTATTPVPVQTFTPLQTTLPATGATTGIGPTTVASEPVPTGPATVPSGAGVFSVTSVGNVPVGGIGRVQLVVDNAWDPNFGDTYIDVGFDPAAVRYLSSTIHVSNTTAAARADGKVRVMLGDFRNGYPEGRYALADLYFTPLREGTAPLAVTVDHVRYWNSDFTMFTDISSSASTQDGSISTGPASATVATLAPVTGNPVVTYETVVPAETGSGSAPVATTATVAAGSVNRDTDEYTGVTPRNATPTPTPTPNATATPTPTAPPATLPPTTVTTNATPTPNATPNATPTVPPATPAATPTPTPTGAGLSLPVTLPAPLPLAVPALAVLGAGALALRRARR